MPYQQHFVPIQSIPNPPKPEKFKHELSTPVFAYRNTGTIKVMNQTQPVIKEIPKFDIKNPEKPLPDLGPDDPPYSTTSFVETIIDQINRKEAKKIKKETQSVEASTKTEPKVRVHYDIVVDASGSMKGHCAKTAKKSALFIAKLLFKKRLTHHIGLYFFSDIVVRQLNIHNYKEFKSAYDSKWNEIPKNFTNLTLLVNNIWEQHQHRQRSIVKRSNSQPDLHDGNKDNVIHQTRVLIITDGEPDNQETVKDSIVQITSNLKDDSSFRLSFIQVADDQAFDPKQLFNHMGLLRATKFLEELDNGLKDHGAKLDIVDHVSWFLMGGDTLLEHVIRCFKGFWNPKQKTIKQ